MPIIGTLPNNIANGQAVDANPVMADFNFIVNQVNANGAPLGTLTAPSGTTMAFQQSTAPLGWTAQTGTAFIDAFLRCVTPASFSGSGGVNGASGFFLTVIAVDGHSLTIGELAAHTHTDSGHTHVATDSGHNHPFAVQGVQSTPGASSGFVGPTGTTPNGNYNSNTSNSFAAVTNANASANIQSTGSGTAHSHTYTANCKYIDQIIAVKS